MTRRSGRPQHLSPGHLSAVMAWYSSSVCSIPCLDQALSRFQPVDQRGGTLEEPPTGLGAPLAYYACGQVPQQSSPRTRGRGQGRSFDRNQVLSDLAQRRRSEQGRHPESRGLGSATLEDMPASRDPMG